MISCISPASGNVLESLSTLRFASRAKNIVNQVKRNEIMDVKTMANKLNMQNDLIESLKAKLALGENDHDTESNDVRKKAAKAAKDARSLRGLVVSAPRMMANLKMTGRIELAEQVQDDLKQGLTGRRDLGEIISSHIELLHAHIPQERELMEHMTDILQKNEAESLDDGLSTEESNVGNKGINEEGVHVSDGGSPHSSSGCDALGLQDFLVAVMGGGVRDENTESLEQEQMRYEDLLSEIHPVLLRPIRSKM